MTSAAKYISILPYSHERGPMGGEPYIGPKLGDGPIFEVSVSHLVTHAIYIIRIVAAATIDFSLIQAQLPIESEGGRLSGRYFTLYPRCSHIKWAWLRSLAVLDHSFVLKHGIKLARLGFTAVRQVTYRSYIDYLKFSPYKPAI